MKKLLWAFLLSFLLAVNAFAGEITVGSFNIEWFGSGNMPRTDEQIRLLASYIRALEVDILACQEINPFGDQSGNGTKDWQDLKRELGDNSEAWYGDTGRSQRLAFIWRTDRVEVTDLGELKGIQREQVSGTSAKTFPRIPLTAYVKSLDGGVDFRIITVHLYWTQDKARYAEARKLNEWMSQYLSGADDRDVVLIGDCNTKPMGQGESQDSQTIKNLEKDGIFTCISKAHHEYTTPESQERYDHAFLSSDLMDEYIENSWDVRRELVDVYPVHYRRDISNHVPVTLRIRDVDNDNRPAGDWGD